MMCSHKSCSHDEKIWLPIEISHSSEAALHPWCIHCGLIKNISDDKPKKMGYWMNILSRIARRFSFTQCQKHIIAKELQAHEEFEDLYGITGSSQMELFIELVEKYCCINRNNIDSFLC